MKPFVAAAKLAFRFLRRPRGLLLLTLVVDAPWVTAFSRC